MSHELAWMGNSRRWEHLDRMLGADDGYSLQDESPAENMQDESDDYVIGIHIRGTTRASPSWYNEPEISPQPDISDDLESEVAIVPEELRVTSKQEMRG